MRKAEEMANTTPWFDGRKKPARRGVYQQKDGHGQTIGYQYWDGSVWYAWCTTAREAFDARRCFPAAADCQNDKWRGLLAPNVAGNRLAEGKSELTGLLGGPIRSEQE